MKRKFLILTLCFTLVFTSINYKKSYADGGVISLPILATVSSLAVASGIIIKNNDDLYDLGKLFYDYIDNHNDLTWEVLKTTFNSSVAVLKNGLVSTKSKFLDIVKGFFDTTFNNTTSDVFVSGTPIYPSFAKFEPGTYESYKIVKNTSSHSIQLLLSDGSWKGIVTINHKDGLSGISFQEIADGADICYYILNGEVRSFTFNLPSKAVLFKSATSAFPYEGGYNWDNVESKKENESIALPIPGNLGQLVGQSNKDFWDNTDSLVGTGGITIPDVNNPSISVDNTDSFPKVEDVPDVDVPDVDVPESGVVVPSFPSFGDSLDFSPMYLTNVTEKFPFSLPWDIGRLISKFDVEPVAPVFDIPIFSEIVTLDLTLFDELVAIVRFFVLIGFILSLIFISTRLLG